MKSLVIVESGAKAKKIKGYLDSNFPDKDWQVEACVGHVRDLSDAQQNAVREINNCFHYNTYHFNTSRNSSWFNDNCSCSWRSYIKYIN